MTHALVQSIPVYPAEAITVVNGANLGDPLSFATELDLDDTYELHLGGALQRLSISSDASGALAVADACSLGHGERP